MYVTFEFFIVFICLFVCLFRRGGVRGNHRPGWAVGERGAGGGPGAPVPTVRGSTLFLGAGAGRNYSHPRVINSAAPVRVRQRYPCPTTYPRPRQATAHPPPSPREGDGRPRRWLRLASPRMPSAASIFLPPAPASSVRAPAPRPDRRERRRPGCLCSPAFARPAGSPAVSPDPILSTSKVSRTSIVACFAACRGFIFEKGGIYFSAGAPEWVKWSRVNPSLKGLQTATVSH